MAAGLRGVEQEQLVDAKKAGRRGTDKQPKGEVIGSLGGGRTLGAGGWRRLGKESVG